MNLFPNERDEEKDDRVEQEKSPVTGETTFADAYGADSSPAGTILHNGEVVRVPGK